ncbi:MAG: acetate--CoA ligase family protein [Candidatus Methanomethylophilaceae archaeon]
MKGFFHPYSVAVIGASADASKVGGMILRNLISSGYSGDVYPVNIKGGTIQGLQAYTSVDLIKKGVDLAVISLKPQFVLGEIDKLGKKGTRNVIIITAGFKEEGTQGREMENSILETAKKYGMRVIGPNCFGIMDTSENLNTTFSSLFPIRGNMALISQSGAVGATMLDWSLQSNIGISKFVSLGNKMDVTESELLAYLKDDTATKVIGLYSESISDGSAFVRSAEALKGKKPMVILKAGRTSAGSKAASSHTGALAGVDSVYDILFRKLNIVRVNDLDEFFDALSVFSLCDEMKNDGIVIVSNAGGLGVMAADACASNRYISVAELSRGTIERIRDEIPTAASVANPIDLRGDAKSDYFGKAIRIASEDPRVGGIVVLSSPLDTIDLDSVADTLIDIKGSVGVPIVVSFAGGAVCERAASVLRSKGIPTFSSPERAVGALGFLRAYGVNSGNSRTPLRLPTDSGRDVVLQIGEIARSEGRVSLSEEEGKRILSAYGIPVPEEMTATISTEAVEAAEKIGYPVVMKVISADIQHKTDVGGVIVGVRDAKGVKDAYESIMTRCKIAVPNAKIDGVTIQKMAAGQEVILSMVRDKQFGPVISFGLGGIYVEIIGEISQALLPMSEEDLRDMMTSTKAYRMLSGARGKPPADIESLRNVILRLIKIAMENEEIYELEINPVMVGKKNEGSWAVDALTTLRWIK